MLVKSAKPYFRDYHYERRCTADDYMGANSRLFKRSKPMQAPHRQATRIRTKKSRFCARENWVFKYSQSVMFCLRQLFLILFLIIISFSSSGSAASVELSRAPLSCVSSPLCRLYRLSAARIAGEVYGFFPSLRFTGNAPLLVRP